MSKRPTKVLIVAPNASSRFGGEAFLPLKYFQLRKRRGLPTRLVTHARNREDLAAYLGPFIGDVVFVEDTRAYRTLYALARRLPHALQIVLTAPLLEWANGRIQSKLIRREVESGRVDLIHQPMPVSPLSLTNVHTFSAPYVIGPMNGAMNYPKGYEDMERPGYQSLVRVGRGIGRALNTVQRGKHGATALLVANARTADAIAFLHHPKVIHLPENGVDFLVWDASAQSRPPGAEAGTLRLVFSGRLIPLKAVDVTLEAISIARKAGVVVDLEILGDGTDRARLEGIVERLQLADCVHFRGFIPQAQCVAYFQRSDALILNSIHECGGAVVLEAMAMGLPVIGPDWGGPADYIDESNGILVSPVPRDTYASRTADAIIRLAGDPELRRRLGEAGQAMTRKDYDWDRKADRMEQIYADALGIAEAHAGPAKRASA